MRFAWTLLAAAVAFLLLRHVGTLILVEGPRADLDIVIQAARRFLAGESMYRLQDPFEHTKPPLLMGLVFWLPWIPHFWIRWIWDLVVFAMPFLILREVLRLSGERWSWRSSLKPGLLTWVVLYPFWYKEAGYGQYNLFNFWLTLLAGRWLSEPQSIRHWGAGAWVAITLLLKPTQLLLLPWVLCRAVSSQESWRKMARFAGGGIVLGLIALTLYAGFSSWEAVIQSHHEWLEFMPRSTAKHLLGANNYGLPTALTRMGMGPWVTGPLWMGLGFGLATLLAWKLKERRSESLDLSVFLMVAFSPMSWKANLGVLVGLTWALGSRRSWLGLFALFAVSRASEYWIGERGMQVYGWGAGPLWLVALAIFLRMRPSRELDLPSK